MRLVFDRVFAMPCCVFGFICKFVCPFMRVAPFVRVGSERFTLVPPSIGKMAGDAFWGRGKV